MGQIIKYNISKSESDSRNTSAIISGNIPITEGNNGSIDCELWGQRFRGNDINGTMRVYGDIFLDVDQDSDVEEDEEINDNPLLDDDDDEEEEITGTLYGNVEGSSVYGKVGYINYPNADSEKTNIADLIKTNADNIKKNADNIEINKTNIASNLNEINALKSRVSTNETNIANNTTAIEINEKNIELNEIAIKNNADEIVALKNRTTANETAIENYLPIGSIIMFSGTMEQIPDGWAICNGENGTPNLIGKFIKAWTAPGVTGGSNSVMLSSSNLPELKLKVDNEKINDNKSWEVRLNKYIPTLDKVGEYVFDEGGSTHYCLYTGKHEGDEGLLGVKYTALFNDIETYTYIGEKNNTQTAINTEPDYYSLIYIMKIA